MRARHSPLLVAAVALLGATAPAAPAVASAEPAAARDWRRPVDGPVLRLFSMGSDRFAGGQHRGVDLAAQPGTPVRASCGGRVSFAGRVPRGGLSVSVRCGRLVATYQHLGAARVRRGQSVAPGTWIGRAGSARPHPHVHLGARDRLTGAYVDPLTLLAGAPRALPPPPAGARRAPPPGPAVPGPAPLGPAPLARGPGRAAPAPARGTRRPLRSGRPPAAPWPPPATSADRLPWPVWLGLALLGLGTPLGRLVQVRARCRRGAAPQPRAAS